MSGETAARVVPVEGAREELFDVYLLLTEDPDDVWKQLLPEQQYRAPREPGGRVNIRAVETPGDKVPAVHFRVQSRDVAGRVVEAIPDFIERTNQLRAQRGEIEQLKRADADHHAEQNAKAAADLQRDITKRL